MAVALLGVAEMKSCAAQTRKKKTWGMRRRLQLFLQNNREYYGAYDHDHQHLEGIKFEATTENGKGSDYGLMKACVSSSLEPVRSSPLFVYNPLTHIQTHTRAWLEGEMKESYIYFDSPQLQPNHGFDFTSFLSLIEQVVFNKLVLSIYVHLQGAGYRQIHTGGHTWMKEKNCWLAFSSIRKVPIWLPTCNPALDLTSSLTLPLCLLQHNKTETLLTRWWMDS